MSREKTDIENDQMNSVQKRRAALKSILLSGGVVSGASALPTAWTRPVIDSVMLPSHASTTMDETDSGSDSQMEEQPVSYFWMQSYVQLDDSQERGMLFAERVLDTVIPTANATDAYPINVFYICLSILGGAYSGTIGAMVQDNPVKYTVSGTVGTAATLPAPDVNCGSLLIQATTLLVHSVNPSSCQCRFESDGTSQNIGVNQGSCPGEGLLINC